MCTDRVVGVAFIRVSHRRDCRTMPDEVAHSGSAVVAKSVDVSPAFRSIVFSFGVAIARFTTTAPSHPDMEHNHDTVGHQPTTDVSISLRIAARDSIHLHVASSQ